MRTGRWLAAMSTYLRNSVTSTFSVGDKVGLIALFQGYLAISWSQIYCSVYINTIWINSKHDRFNMNFCATPPLFLALSQKTLAVERLSLRYDIGHHTLQSKGWRQRQFMRSFGKFCSLMNEICKWLNLKPHAQVNQGSVKAVVCKTLDLSWTSERERRNIKTSTRVLSAFKSF